MSESRTFEIIPANLNNYPRIGDTPEQQKLRRTIAALDRGEATVEDLKKVQNEVTREVIQEQVDAGVKLVTDGQIRWDDPITYFARALDGVRITGLVRYYDTNTYFRQPLVEGEIRWKGPVLVEDYLFAREVSPVPVKAVVTGPYTLARLSLDEHYGDVIALTRAFAAALRSELGALIEAGAEVIQIDEPSLVRHPDRAADALPALNELVDVSRPAHVKIGVLTYWGNLGGMLDELLSLPIDFVSLDLVEGRADLERLKSGVDLKGKWLGLGLVDGRNTKMEKPEDVAATVRELQSACGFARCYLHPSCGLELVPRDVARRKLELVAAAAQIAAEGS